MLIHKSDVNTRDVKLEPKNIEIFFTDNGAPIFFELPSAEELAVLREGYEIKLSIPAIANNDPLDLKSRHKLELETLLLKGDRFGKSASYFTRLSDLASLADSKEQARKYLEKAVELEQENQYLKHDLGDILLEDVSSRESARRLFSELDLTQDVYANLRLAYIAISDEDIPTARRLVAEALSIDPENYQSRMFFGAICLSDGNFEIAVRNLKIATEINPYTSVGFVNLSVSYWSLGQQKKAYSAAKRAVILNPFNENAVSLFADISYLLDANEECISALEHFLSYEQNTPRVWSQLARAHYTIGKRVGKKSSFAKALSALRHNESLDSSPIVWNNMSLVAWELGDKEAARRYLSYALKKSVEDNRGIALTLINLTALMIDLGKYKEIYPLFEQFLPRIDTSIEKPEIVEKLYLKRIVLTDAVGKTERAQELTLSYLKEDIQLEEVELELIVRAIYYYTTESPDIEQIITYAPRILQLVNNENNASRMLKERAINNLVFAYLSFDRLDDASQLLGRLGSSFYKDPFATATLGMWHIKTGEIDRGVTLYDKAVSLLTSRKDKKRFRQRMHLELGKFFFLKSEYKHAIRNFEKAKNTQYGFGYVNKEIAMIERLIPSDL